MIFGGDIRAIRLPARPAPVCAWDRSSAHVTPHRLRYSYATELLRLGVSLPALMRLLGHKDIRMTFRYVLVTQQDLQREFHQVRQEEAQPHRLPALSLPHRITAPTFLESAER